MAGNSPSDRAKRRADWALLVAYHEAKLADLLEHVRADFVQYDAGEMPDWWQAAERMRR